VDVQVVGEGRRVTIGFTIKFVPAKPRPVILLVIYLSPRSLKPTLAVTGYYLHEDVKG
jgi:hypothetical protein